MYVLSIFRLRSVKHLSKHSILHLHVHDEARFASSSSNRGMKRKAETSPEASSRKSSKVDDYCSVEPRRDENGNFIWPAPESQLDAARTFLKEW